MDWEIVKNKWGDREWLKFQDHTVIHFSVNPFRKDDGPTSNGKKSSEVVNVSLVESWRGGGKVLVEWENNNTEECWYGKRKPGTVGKLTGARQFPQSRPRDGRRKGY